jgi:hypothetical protein
VRDIEGTETVVERLRPHWKAIEAYFEDSVALRLASPQLRPAAPRLVTPGPRIEGWSTGRADIGDVARSIDTPDNDPGHRSYLIV